MFQQLHPKPTKPRSVQWSLSMTGGQSGPEIRHFWQHLFEKEEWENHPAKFLSYIQLDRSLAYQSKFGGFVSERWPPNGVKARDLDFE